MSDLDLSLDDCLDLLGAGRNHKARLELEALRAQLATVQAERDAAVRDGCAPASNQCVWELRYYQANERVGKAQTALARPSDTRRLVVTEAVIAGALFDFAARLTVRDTIVLGRSHHPEPVVNALKEWASERGLSLDDAQVGQWTDAIGERDSGDYDSFSAGAGQ